MIDLDDFKQINDRYGHVIGDKVLLGLADHLRSMLGADGSGCFAGRWGGEEFMVVMPDASLDRAAALAERIRKGFEQGGCGRALHSRGRRPLRSKALGKEPRDAGMNGA